MRSGLAGDRYDGSPDRTRPGVTKGVSAPYRRSSGPRTSVRVISKTSTGKATAGWILPRIARAVLVLALLGAGTLFAAATATAAAISSQSIGINSQPDSATNPSDLSVASGSGVGVVRLELEQRSGSTAWDHANEWVTLAAKANLRVVPTLGLSSQMSPSAAATAMASYVSAFAKRYGPSGSFWSSNPQLPYLPVTTYEIGNEPNIPIAWAQDDTHLHWPAPNGSTSTPPDPVDYATVYEASRAALHAVDPSAVVVVGGLADSDGLGVDVSHDEGVLAAISGTVDAVGFHPYAWQGSPNNLSVMQTDLEALRQWMNAHGMQGVPIEMNEVGACGGPGQGCYRTFTSAQWGAFVSGYMQWALCTPSLGVNEFGAFYWGDEQSDSSDPYLSLVSNTGGATPYGQAYLGTAHTLTTQGCPSPGSLPPPGGMLFRIRGVHVHRHRLLVVVREVPGSGHVTVIAVRRHHRIRLHLIRRRRGHTLLTFAAKLPAGRWTVIVKCVPPAGYAAPAQRRRHVKIRR